MMKRMLFAVALAMVASLATAPVVYAQATDGTPQPPPAPTIGDSGESPAIPIGFGPPDAAPPTSEVAAPTEPVELVEPAAMVDPAEAIPPGKQPPVPGKQPPVPGKMPGSQVAPVSVATGVIVSVNPKQSTFAIGSLTGPGMQIQTQQAAPAKGKAPSAPTLFRITADTQFTGMVPAVAPADPLADQATGQELVPGKGKVPPQPPVPAKDRGTQVTDQAPPPEKGKVPGAQLTDQAPPPEKGKPTGTQMTDQAPPPAKSKVASETAPEMAGDQEMIPAKGKVQDQAGPSMTALQVGQLVRVVYTQAPSADLPPAKGGETPALQVPAKQKPTQIQQQQVAPKAKPQPQVQIQQQQTPPAKVKPQPTQGQQQTPPPAKAGPPAPIEQEGGMAIAVSVQILQPAGKVPGKTPPGGQTPGGEF